MCLGYPRCPASVCWFFAAGLDRGKTKIDPLGPGNPPWLAPDCGAWLESGPVNLAAQGRMLTREGAELAICLELQLRAG